MRRVTLGLASDADENGGPAELGIRSELSMHATGDAASRARCGKIGGATNRGDPEREPSEASQDGRYKQNTYGWWPMLQSSIKW